MNKHSNIVAASKHSSLASKETQKKRQEDDEDAWETQQTDGQQGIRVRSRRRRMQKNICNNGQLTQVTEEEEEEEVEITGSSSSVSSSRGKNAGRRGRRGDSSEPPRGCIRPPPITECEDQDDDYQPHPDGGCVKPPLEYEDETEDDDDQDQDEYRPSGCIRPSTKKRYDDGGDCVRPLNPRGRRRTKKGNDDDDDDDEDCEPDPRHGRPRIGDRGGFDDGQPRQPRGGRRGLQVKHFKHRHSLEPCNLRKKDGRQCKFCTLIISGSAYACVRNCDFYLHEVCFRIPEAIKHDSHRDHSLTVRSFKQADKDDFYCVACDEESPILFRYYYYCSSSCSFGLHIECASMPSTMNLNRKGKNMSLARFYSCPKKNDAGNLFCQICREIVTKENWVYYDSNWDFISHFECAFNDVYGREDDEDFIVGVLNRLLLLQTNNEDPVDDKAKPEEVKPIWPPEGDVMHHAHPGHPLEKIICAPTEHCSLCYFSKIVEENIIYKCRRCDFQMCLDCFALPQEIEHQAHPGHLLTVVYKGVGGGISCKACDSPALSYKGFYCSTCRYFLHSLCAIYPATLTLLNENVTVTRIYSFPSTVNKNQKIMCRPPSGRCYIIEAPELRGNTWMYYNREFNCFYHPFCIFQRSREIQDIDESLITPKSYYYAIPTYCFGPKGLRKN